MLHSKLKFWQAVFTGDQSDYEFMTVSENECDSVFITFIPDTRLMAEDSDSVIDLTQSSNHDSTLADHNRLHNTVINLDTPPPPTTTIHAEENLESNNRRPVGGRKRPYSETRATDPRVPAHFLCTSTSAPGNRSKRRFKDSKKESKKIAITEEPLEKKAKQSLGYCAICHEEYGGQRLATTKCGHVFCLDCLKRVISKNPRCPTCRTMLKGKSAYHAIFL